MFIYFYLCTCCAAKLIKSNKTYRKEYRSRPCAKLGSFTLCTLAVEKGPALTNVL